MVLPNISLRLIKIGFLLIKCNIVALLGVQVVFVYTGFTKTTGSNFNKWLNKNKMKKKI